ncbi:ADP-ribose pyrophosphatase [Bacillus sp. J14TS2]|uniref:NUDIX domain-containing protein n=1 Tax=Bacillus sp. J14TS2 TaxID=2807188 RepID=UPI001B1C7703|nr:NUDIX domain-containing protein [Bacillus sp. J14TS2]GIN73142.1 ADP-ribose pyrophosphatase [Bacillus sp. J14TS2]
MYIAWEDSYLGGLREKIGHQMIIAPAARAIIQNEEGKILFVKRKDNGKWVMPAGGLELHESIYDCLKREVKEEAGIDVISAKPIAMYTGPDYEYTNGYGDDNKMFAIVFLVEEWSGKILKETDETLDAQFFSLDDLPEIPSLYRETIEDLRIFNLNGQIILK